LKELKAAVATLRRTSGARFNIFSAHGMGLHVFSHLLSPGGVGWRFER